jgi:hypothetical protein
MTLVHPPRSTRRARGLRLAPLERATTLGEFLVLVLVFGAVVGLAVGTGLAHLLLLVFQHLDHNVRNASGR